MNFTITPEAAGAIAGISVIATGLTKKVMDWTAGWFDKKRFAPLVSLLCCAVASLAWEAMNPGGSWPWIGARSVLAWAGSTTLHSGIKSAAAIARNGGGNGQ